MDRGRIAVLVSNDLTFDQRVRRPVPPCNGRAGSGPDRTADEPADAVTSTGRIERNGFGSGSTPAPCSTCRSAWTPSGVGPPPEGRGDGGWANDLDTLGPAVEASRRYGWAVAYDSREWFTEAEGLKGSL